MKVAMCLATVVLAGTLLCGSTPAEDSSYRAMLSYSELISHGLINAYSTNVLVQAAFAGRCLTRTDAEDAVKRNLAFVNILQKYANDLKRASSGEDEGMKKLIGDMCDVTTYLELQTESLKDWVADPENKSARLLYEKYCAKVEKGIDTMLKR